MLTIATPSASNQIQTQRVLYCYCSELVTQCYQVMAQTGEPSMTNKQTANSNFIKAGFKKFTDSQSNLLFSNQARPGWASARVANHSAGFTFA